MLKNYLKIALRNLLKYKTYSVINILGLALGLCSSILILLFVRDELNYDTFKDMGDRDRSSVWSRISTFVPCVSKCGR